MLKSSKQPELARQFMDFIQTDGFQTVIPTANWMYPTQKIAIPEEFASLVQPKFSWLFSPEDVAENQKKWIDEWLQASQ